MVGGIVAVLNETIRPSVRRGMSKAILCALFSGSVLLASLPAQAQQGEGSSQNTQWATCLEAIVAVQNQLQKTTPPPSEPAEQAQSIAAQDSAQPTPGSLAAAGLDQPTSGAMGALNEAMNLQAAGDEAGCFKAVAKARELAGLN
ncbi:hypothetical protein ACT6QH_07605 [Xanthobacter sp. TB0139]|uniref:hypothetical protein n=1 Tax=Xanthobacter sp. TB0139 TaxID=3459178 RepID=UPI00403A68FA